MVDTQLQQILRLLDEKPAPAAYSQAAREIRSLKEQLQPVRVALLSSFTVRSLAPYLEVEAARRGFAADVYVGPFNGVVQELVDPGSGCNAHKPDVVFIAQQLSEVSPSLVNDYLALEPSQVDEQIHSVATNLMAALEGFRRSSSAAIVVHNFALPPYPLLGIYEPVAELSQTDAIRKLNARLAEAVKSIPGVYLLDYDRLASETGYRNWYDDKMWHLGRAPLSAQAMPTLAREWAVFVGAILGKPRKCLVLDLDNTLWGGVVGEDGVAGIKLGRTYPGSVFRQFQEVLLQLYRQGVVLAINSKNNPADVDEVFRSHPDMVLKPEHFASKRINWQDKPANMLEIAEELNIGVDSLVFFDDNPAERELMRQALPQVLTLNIPNDPMKFSQVLQESRALEKLSFTDEDRRRGEMYKQQSARREFEQSAMSLEDFYKDLDMTVRISPLDDFASPRALDLLHKTNQFNLTTRRYSAGQLTEMVADPKCGVFYLQAGDRFGDHGIVGLAIVRLERASAVLDTLLLSCRVIGRTVETAFLSFLADWSHQRGATQLEGEFIITAKNAPAAGFFEQHGFVHVSSDDVSSRWRLSLDSVPFGFPAYIRRV